MEPVAGPHSISSHIAAEDEFIAVGIMEACLRTPTVMVKVVERMDKFMRKHGLKDSDPDAYETKEA